MSKNVVTLRYAKAMLDGLSGQHLKDLQSDIRAFADLIDGSDLKVVLASPLVSKTKLKSIFDDLFTRIKPHLRLQGLVLAMAANGRGAYLRETLATADSLISSQGGAAQATVTAAKPLNDGEREQIAKALSARVGKPVTLDTAVDESLIGGMVVRLDSLQIDDSVKTKLDRLRRHLSGKAA